MGVNFLRSLDSQSTITGCTSRNNLACMLPPFKLRYVVVRTVPFAAVLSSCDVVKLDCRHEVWHAILKDETSVKPGPPMPLLQVMVSSRSICTTG